MRSSAAIHAGGPLLSSLMHVHTPPLYMRIHRICAIHAGGPPADRRPSRIGAGAGRGAASGGRGVPRLPRVPAKTDLAACFHENRSCGVFFAWLGSGRGGAGRDLGGHGGPGGQGQDGDDDDHEVEDLPPPAYIYIYIYYIYMRLYVFMHKYIQGVEVWRKTTTYTRSKRCSPWIYIFK